MISYAKYQIAFFSHAYFSWLFFNFYCFHFQIGGHFHSNSQKALQVAFTFLKRFTTAFLKKVAVGGDFINVATRRKEMLRLIGRKDFFNKWNKCHTSSNCHLKKKSTSLYHFWKLLKCLSFLRYFGWHSAFLIFMLCHVTFC